MLEPISTTMNQTYEDLWKEKTLEEIDALIKLDPEFHVFYLMRANYNVRRCQNDAIRSCEIKHIINRILCHTTRLNLRVELVIKAEAVKIALKKLKLKNELIVMCKKILSDFEKASEIFEREFKLYKHLKSPNFERLDQILSTNPVSSFEYAIRARYIENSFSSQARSDFKRSLEMNAKNFFTMSYFGEHLIESGGFPSVNFNDGIKYIRKSCEIEPVFYNNYIVFADHYDKVGMLEFGIREYSTGSGLLQTVVEYDDYFRVGASLTLTLRGLAYVAIEKNELARRDFTKGIEFYPGDDLAYACRGSVNLEMERYEESILDYTEALKLGNMDLDLYDCRVERNIAVQRWKERIMKS